MIVRTKKLRYIPLLLFDKGMITLDTCHKFLFMVSEENVDELLNTMKNLGIDYETVFDINEEEPITMDTLLDVLINWKDAKTTSSYKSIW